MKKNTGHKLSLANQLPAEADEGNPKKGPGNFRERAVAAVKDAGLSMDDQKQAVIDAGGNFDNDEDEAIERVDGKKMLIKFIKPRFSRDEQGEPWVGFEISMQLTDAHKGLLPSDIEDEWKHLTRGNVKRTDIETVEPQTIEFYLTKDSKASLRQAGCRVERASLAKVEETGNGEAKPFIRLTCIISTELTDSNGKWSLANFGNPMWLTMESLQQKLPLR